MMTNRQLDILEILLEKDKTTTKEIADQLKVNRRTIERHIDMMCLKGIPIITKAGRNGGVYIDKTYKVDKSFFTESEMVNLFLAASIYHNIFGSDYQKSMIQKMLLLNPDLITNIKNVTEKYFVADLFNDKIHVELWIKQAIDTAILGENYIRCKLKNKIISLIPLSYVLKKDGLYLYGFDEKYMMVKLSKSVEVEVDFEKIVAKDKQFLGYREHKNIEVIV